LHVWLLHITRCFFTFQSSRCHKFPKTNALAVINLENNTHITIVDEDPEVQADSVGASPSSLNDKQEIEPVECNIPQGFLDHKILS
jgi:hypothetical protein